MARPFVVDPVAPLLRPPVRPFSPGAGVTLAEAVAAAFTGGQTGAMYVIDPAYLWQDEAGTTPATADGDPVGRLEDVSGNGNHATSPVPATLRGGVGNWRLEFDGVDDYYDLPLALLQNVSAAYLGFAGTYRTLAGADNAMIWFSTGTSGTRTRLNTRATTYLQAAGRRLDGDSFDTGVQAEVIVQGLPFSTSARFDYTNAAVSLTKDGGEIASGIFSTAGNTSDTPSAEAYLGFQAGEYTAMDARAFVILTGGFAGTDVMDEYLASLT